MKDDFFNASVRFVIEKDGQFIVTSLPKIIIEFDFIIFAESYKRFNDTVAIFS